MLSGSVTQQWIRRFHQKQGDKVFQEALKQVQGQAKRNLWIWFWVIFAFALCALSLIWAVVVWTQPGHGFFEVFLASCCAGMVLWVLYQMRQSKEATLPREKAPELYRLLDELRQALNHTDPIEVVLIPDFNAYYTRTVGGKAIMGFGAPLLVLLSPQEWVAVMAHEIAHGVKQDPLRSRQMAFPLTYFGTWYQSLTPDGLMLSQGGESIITQISNYLLWALAQLPRGILYLMHFTLMQDSQVAEYRADALAAKISGHQHLQHALRKLYLSGVFAASVHKQTRHPERPSLYQEFQHQLENLKPETLQELEKQARQESHAYASHPPTHERQRFLDLCPAEPSFVLAEDRAGHIWQELQPLLVRLQKDTLDEYRYHLDG